MAATFMEKFKEGQICFTTGIVETFFAIVRENVISCKSQWIIKEF